MNKPCLECECHCYKCQLWCERYAMYEKAKDLKAGSEAARKAEEIIRSKPVVRS